MVYLQKCYMKKNTLTYSYTILYMRINTLKSDPVKPKSHAYENQVKVVSYSNLSPTQKEIILLA